MEDKAIPKQRNPKKISCRKKLQEKTTGKKLLKKKQKKQNKTIEKNDEKIEDKAISKQQNKIILNPSLNKVA